MTLQTSERLAAATPRAIGAAVPGEIREVKAEATREQSSDSVRIAVTAIREAARERASLGSEIQRLRGLAATLHRERRQLERRMAALQGDEERLRSLVEERDREIVRLCDALEQQRLESERTIENGAALVRKLAAELDHQRRGREAEVRQLRALLDGLRRAQLARPEPSCGAGGETPADPGLSPSS